MQQGRVHVMNMHRIADHIVTEVVGLSVRHSSSNAATRHPDAVATRVVVAAKVGGRQRSLAEDGASELTGPDNERVLQ